jgi:hypothetical protein
MLSDAARTQLSNLPLTPLLLTLSLTHTALPCPADFLIIGGRRLTASDLQQVPPEALAAGLAAARRLQQLPGIFNNLGGWLSGAASAINNVPMPRVDTSRLGNLPFLPQLLPNGTNNPLFNTLKDVTGEFVGAAAAAAAAVVVHCWFCC